MSSKDFFQISSSLFTASIFIFSLLFQSTVVEKTAVYEKTSEQCDDHDLFKPLYTQNTDENICQYLVIISFCYIIRSLFLISKFLFKTRGLHRIEKHFSTLLYHHLFNNLISFYSLQKNLLFKIERQCTKNQKIIKW